MDCSFTASGEWFAFCTATGQTLKRGFRTKPQAVLWISAQLRGQQ